MKLDKHNIKQILYIKNNCTVLEFVGYVNCVASHFAKDSMSFDEVVEILQEIVSDDDYHIRLQMVPPYPNAETHLCIINLVRPYKSIVS